MAADQQIANGVLGQWLAAFVRTFSTLAQAEVVLEQLTLTAGTQPPNWADERVVRLDVAAISPQRGMTRLVVAESAAVALLGEEPGSSIASSVERLTTLAAMASSSASAEVGADDSNLVLAAPEMSVVATSELVAGLSDAHVLVTAVLRSPTVQSTPLTWIVDAELAASVQNLVNEPMEHDDVTASTTDADDVIIAPASFPVVSNPSTAVGPSADMHMLSDVTLEVTVELGRTTMRLRDVLELGPGRVIELDRPAGAPVDVLVNGTLVARGDVVVVDDDLGVRISEVVDPDDR